MKSLFLFCLLLISNHGNSQITTHWKSESSRIDSTKFITVEEATNYFEFFKFVKESDTSLNPLFNWKDFNNCEDRANATSILLDSWGIPNYKIWIFGNSLLNKKGKGGLACKPSPRRRGKNICWKYHVATIIPVLQDGNFSFIVIDPATLTDDLNISEWCVQASNGRESKYFITSSEQFNWSSKGSSTISSASFYTRINRLEDTMEGLAGFNTARGKERRRLKKPSGKKKLKITKDRFDSLNGSKPLFD